MGPSLQKELGLALVRIGDLRQVEGAPLESRLNETCDMFRIPLSLVGLKLNLFIFQSGSLIFLGWGEGLDWMLVTADRLGLRATTDMLKNRTTELEASNLQFADVVLQFDWLWDPHFEWVQRCSPTTGLESQEQTLRDAMAFVQHSCARKPETARPFASLPLERGMPLNFFSHGFQYNTTGRNVRNGGEEGRGRSRSCTRGSVIWVCLV